MIRFVCLVLAVVPSMSGCLLEVKKANEAAFRNLIASARRNYDQIVDSGVVEGDCLAIEQCPQWRFLVANKPPDYSRLIKLIDCGSVGVRRLHCCPFIQSNGPVIFEEEQQETADSNRKTWLPSECGTANNLHLQLRITGGRNATVGRFPWMVRLAYKPRRSDLEHPDDDFRCGGVLISDRHVLTAAHCAQSRDIRVFSIRLGEFDARTDPDCVESGDRLICSDRVVDVAINQSDITVHEQFNERSQQNDIALIRLPRPVTFTDSIRPVCLPIETIEKPPELTVAGWGLDSTSTNADVLQQVDLSWYPIDECQRLYGSHKRPIAISDRLQFCLAGHQGRDACRGDSGGPAMVTGGRRTYAVGIVSFGPVLCGNGVPAVLTWVPAYLTWIRDHIHQ